MGDLSFNPATHEYSLGGVVLPSVTTILKAMGLYPDYPEHTDFYRKRGTAVHRGSEALMHGRLALNADGSVSDKTDARIRGYIQSLQRWLAASGFRPMLIEQPLHSDQWMMAGTLDAYGMLGEQATIVDLKSGEPAKPAAQLQTAGYAIMLKEQRNLPTHRRLALHLDENGRDAKPEEFGNLQEDIRHMLSAASLYHLRSRHGLL